MTEANLLLPNFDAFPRAANVAGKHPNQEGEAPHRRHCNDERPRGLAERVTDDSAKCRCASLLRESNERRGGARPSRKWRHGTREPLRHGQSKAKKIERGRDN